MDYREILKKTDLGKKFGLIKSPDFYTSYHKYNSYFLEMLFNKIGINDIIIADYGGGNAILAKEVVKFCNKKEINNFSVENIDVDYNKFVEFTHLVNIEKDITTYKARDRYDYALSRFVLHYLDKEKQLQFLKNVYDNLKKGGHFLLIHYLAGDVARKVCSLIESRTLIKRGPFSTEEEVIKMCKEVGFEVVKTRKVDNILHINDFHKNRFNLSDAQIREICEEVGTTLCEGAQIAILFKK